MNILVSPLFEKQLQEILEQLATQDYQKATKFKMYLDTIIINMPTKAKKYKKSILFDDDNIKEILHEDFIIIFFIDNSNNNYLVLSIYSK